MNTINEFLNKLEAINFNDVTGKALKYQNSDNYTHTFSRSENNDDDVNKAIASGLNVAAVFANDLPTTWKGIQVIDGDAADDLMIKYKGVIIGLRAKGKAKKDQSGFVIQNY